MDVNNNLRIAHCIASIDKNAGGTTTALLDILKEESKSIFLELYTLNSNNQIDVNAENLQFFSEDPTIFDYSLDLGSKIKKSDADLFHGHALWSLALHQMSATARQLGKPYLISIHGMLHEWSLKQSKIKKNSIGIVSK